MSKKRTSAESREDEQTIHDSDVLWLQHHLSRNQNKVRQNRETMFVFERGQSTTGNKVTRTAAIQHADNAKRAKPTPLSGTTMQDLPNELIESILFEAVVMEVRKLVRRVWREAADRVIDRLRTVCSQWNSVLATDFFRKEVHRTLESIDLELFRMEFVHRLSSRLTIIGADVTMDKIFLLFKTSGQDRMYAIGVYNRSNVTEVKEIIPLPEILPESLKACSVSNCLYVLNEAGQSQSLLRVKKDDTNQWKMSPWINDFDLAASSNRISVAVNGSLILVSNQRECNSTVISIYSTSGSLQQRLLLSQDVYGFKCIDSAILKINGNLLLVALDKYYKMTLLEIDMTGRIARKYESSFTGFSGVIFSDVSGRIMLADIFNRIELLDSEFNLMDFAGPKLRRDQFILPFKVTYNSDTNEALAVLSNGDLALFRFAVERVTQNV